MVQTTKDKIPNVYCPECQNPMLIFGFAKHGMVRCILKTCNNTIQKERALQMKDTLEGREIYKQGYNIGYEDGEYVGSVKGGEFLD
jgi:hypothetical protein